MQVLNRGSAILHSERQCHKDLVKEPARPAVAPPSLLTAVLAAGEWDRGFGETRL